MLVLELYNLGIIGKNETAAITYSLTGASDWIGTEIQIYVLGECEAFTKFLALLSITIGNFETFKNVLYTVNTEEEEGIAAANE